MKKYILFASVAASLCSYSAVTNAQATSTSIVPESGAYIGLGFSANSVQFNDQQLGATGISDVSDTQTGAHLSSGSAGGPPVDIGMSGVNALAPAIQAGYFRKLQDSSMFWGAKFSYAYLGGATSTTDRILIPQYGSFGNTAFTGNAVARSYQTTINNQISLIPYFGQSFERSTVYFGIGPTLSQVNTKINNLIGFADINGNRTNISGTAQSFENTEWVWGGAAMLGGSYFIDRSWFVDFNYTYARTKNETANYSSTFNNPSTPYTYSGSLIGSSSGSATVQSLGISINKVF